MKKEWSLANDKAILNFTKRYCTSYDEILDSDGMRSVLEHFLKKRGTDFSRITHVINDTFGQGEEITMESAVDNLIAVCRLLVSMKVDVIASAFPQYHALTEHRNDFLHLIEEIYNYWLGLERYSVLFQRDQNTNLSRVSFVDANSRFKDLILSFYRLIRVNITGNHPMVFRQMTAGINCGMVCHTNFWPIPTGYESLKGIPFIDTILLETPFITYPKRNTRQGFFKETGQNPMSRISVNEHSFFCFPVKVGALLAYVYVHRDFLTHGVSLANLFQFAEENEIAGMRPDIILIFGGDTGSEEPEDYYYLDKQNDMLVGMISHSMNYDYFGYMKKMMLTLHNIHQLHHGNLPIHGAMVKIVLKSGDMANIVIMGDSGAGKSESIEAFRSLADEYISDMTIIFDDMGTFALPSGQAEDGEPLRAYGTEIGAFVRLDDLDSGYAFKQLSRSVFMNPDKTNARLINPVATYDEIMAGEPVDVFLYANNYETVDSETTSLNFFDTKEEAIDVFKGGKRMAKGTTQEKGITTSYFANPFGPHQYQATTDKLIDTYFAYFYEQGIPVGELYTQLGVDGMENAGPEKAALDLFELIKTLKK